MHIRKTELSVRPETHSFTFSIICLVSHSQTLAGRESLVNCPHKNTHPISSCAPNKVGETSLPRRETRLHVHAEWVLSGNEFIVPNLRAPPGERVGLGTRLPMLWFDPKTNK